MRVDTTHLKSVESAVSNDFDELLSSMVTGEGKSYVIRGFEINMPGAVGAAASSLQLIVENSSFLHGNSNTSGTFYEIPTGTDPEILSSTTNEKVEGAFTTNTDNYIGIEFDREVDDATIDQVAFWEINTDIEFTKTVPLAITLNYKIVISTSSFASNVLPIAIVQTDGSNNVVDITDRRSLLCRLGTAGDSEPDPFYNYPWADGREENPYESNSEVSPFQGGDKQIGSIKELFDALMTEIKSLKGTTYWYSESTGGSIYRLRQDSANLTVTGKGTVSHDLDYPTTSVPGRINWSEDFYLNFIGGRLRYTIKANPSSQNIVLLDNQVAYVKLVRGENTDANLLFTNGSATVTSVGGDWTSDLQAGDFIKNAASGDEQYYEIASVDTLTQVTLTENFNEVTTTGGTEAQYAFGEYEAVASPLTDRHIKISDRGSVPFTQDHFWLYSRQDNGGSVANVYVRPLGGGELEQGEDREISDNTSLDLLSYVGSTSESDMDPNYATLATGAKTGTENYNTVLGENLTIRSSKLTSMIADKAQDKTIIFAPLVDYINNTTNGSNQELTFVHDNSGSPELNILMHSSANNGVIGLDGTLTLAVNKVAYFTVDRNVSFSIADLSGLTIVDITALPLEENIFVFAVRETTDSVYLWDGTELVLGKNLSQGTVSEILDSNAYDEPLSVVSGAPSDTNEITGPISPGTAMSLPDDSRDGGSQQGYIVGKGLLEVKLNGQELVSGVDFSEVGSVGDLATTFTTLIDLEVDDILSLRIDTAGGYFSVGIASGETNTGSNLGGQNEVFKGKVGVDLQFRTVRGGANTDVTTTGDIIDINNYGYVSVITKSLDSTLLLTENVILSNASGGDLTITLPSAASSNGKLYNIKKIDASANNVVITADGADLIDGTATLTTNIQYQSFTLTCDGSGWYII